MMAQSHLPDSGGPVFQPWQGSAEALVEAAAGLTPLRWLRGTHMRTKRALLDEWAAVLQFPPHFGGTWDAFRDALSDLPNGATLLVLEADELLQDAPPEEAETFWKVLQQVHADLHPNAFRLILQVKPAGFETLVEGLRALGVG